MATHSSILAWEIRWAEELGGLQSMEWQWVDTTEHVRYGVPQGFLIDFVFIYSLSQLKVLASGHLDLNQGPLDLQSNALPLSYTSRPVSSVNCTSWSGRLTFLQPCSRSRQLAPWQPGSPCLGSLIHQPLNTYSPASVCQTHPSPSISLALPTLAPQCHLPCDGRSAACPT